jgi:hypothetical protein
MDMTDGDAFNDMPEEYREHRLNHDASVEPENVDKDFAQFKSKRAYDPEKPKAVASLYFKYDGGEWLHMAKIITRENHPVASRNFSFTLPGGRHLGLVPDMPAVGRLRVVMLANGDTYEGEAKIDERKDVWDDELSFTQFIRFSMRRDEQPLYKPDPFPNAIPSLNRCPDCDNTLEQRSMPDGIEEWCGECNMKVPSIYDELLQLHLAFLRAKGYILTR